MSVDMNLIKNEFAECNITVRENEIMSAHTSFKIGGCADIFAIPNNVEEFCNSIKIAYKYSIPVFVLGKGSNILVSDSGIRGIVVSTVNNKLVLDFHVIVAYGVSIMAVSENLISNVKYNKYLKIVAQAAHIDKPVSSHWQGIQELLYYLIEVFQCR